MNHPAAMSKNLILAAGAVAGMGASFVLNGSYPDDPSSQKCASNPSGLIAGQTVGAGPGAGRMVPDGYAYHITNGLSWLCPKDPHSKTFAEIVLRQLEGRYLLGANGHLYLRATNHEYSAACRRFFPGPTGSLETWSWLAEIVHFHGPEVWSFPHDATHGEKSDGEQWRGGFTLITKACDREGETICRFFSHQERTWGKWQSGVVAVSADGNLKNGQWNVQWRLEASMDRFVLGNDPSTHPQHAALFREPFFLLPIAANDLP
ncbi:MAG: hypothetical protein PHO89_06960 [Methylacidiphilaceae bacterium]|nr:hypothetical protein [Candidatus Methylacidiphilaceae bacterium]